MQLPNYFLRLAPQETPKWFPTPRQGTALATKQPAGSILLSDFLDERVAFKLVLIWF